MGGVKGQKKGIRKTKVCVFKHPHGYLYLKVRTSTEDKRYKLHKLLLEYKLGRNLKSNEVTHHINENKMDNRLENLDVRLKGEHQRQHQIERGLKSGLKITKRKCSNCGEQKSYVSDRCQKCYLSKTKKRDNKGRFLKGDKY